MTYRYDCREAEDDFGQNSDRRSPMEKSRDGYRGDALYLAGCLNEIRDHILDTEKVKEAISRYCRVMPSYATGEVERAAVSPDTRSRADE